MTLLHSPRPLPLLGAVFLCAAMGACTAPEPAEFRIGLLAIHDDRYWASSGEPSIQGAELAAAEINGAGGVTVGGRRLMVRIVVREYAGGPGAAATQARGLLNQDSVQALVGPQLSAHAIPVSVIAEAAHVSMISPMSTNPETTRGKRFVFRLASLDDVQGSVMARYARDELKATRGAILFDEAVAYSRDLAERFRQAFEAEGGTVVAVERYTTDRATDFTEQLGRIRAARPEVLYLPNAAREDSIQARQAREMGLEARFLGSDSWDLTGYAGLPAVEGVVVTHQWHYELPSPEVAAFLRRFDAVYEGPPRTTAAMTYDAIRILAQAADHAGSLDPEELRGRIAATDGYQGATGRISFKGGRDPDRSVAISTLRDGRIVVLGTIDP